MQIEKPIDTDLDTILTEVGAFGLFQIVTYILICIPSTFSATYQISYMFSASTLQYRCKVPEYEPDIDNRDIQYDQYWINFAIPANGDKLNNCVRYGLRIRSETNISNRFLDMCTPEMFNTSQTIECSESDERNLQTEFNINCMESYKLALIGTIGNIGRFLFLPFVGFLSDRFGRKTTVIYGLVFGSFFGLMKSFANTYLVYIILEFFESFGTTTFAGTFTLAIEWVSSRYRVLGSMIVALAFPIGEILLGTMAMYVRDFRYLIRIMYTPGLFFIIYLWIVPESMRWLLVTGRVNRAINILKTTAVVNGKELSQKSVDIIKMKYSIDRNVNGDFNREGSEKPTALIIKSFRSIFASKTLTYYGLSMTALNVPGMNRYTSFIMIVAFEIPGILIAIPLLKRIERRKLMFTWLFMTAVSIVTTLVPKNKPLLVLISFMVAKTSISCTFNVVYVFIAELWPTNIRTTVMNFCSMIGRIGSMIAPIVVIMASQYESLPAILFSGTAIIGSILVLICPETFYCKHLPDTMEEAKSLK